MAKLISPEACTGMQGNLESGCGIVEANLDSDEIFEVDITSVINSDEFYEDECKSVFNQAANEEIIIINEEPLELLTPRSTPKFEKQKKNEALKTKLGCQTVQHQQDFDSIVGSARKPPKPKNRPQTKTSENVASMVALQHDVNEILKEIINSIRESTTAQQNIVLEIRELSKAILALIQNNN